MATRNSDPLEIDDILSQITMLFSDNSGRRSMTEVNRGLQTNVTMNRAVRARAMMQGAMERFRLTKFPTVRSMDQPIRNVVPPFWILATAMSNHPTAQDRRRDASTGAGDRYMNLANSLAPNHYVHNFAHPDMDTPEYRRRQAEGYLHVQYSYHPDRTLQQYFEEITNKVHAGAPVDVTRFFDDTTEQTAPELLMMTFTRGELDYYGW